MSSRPLRTTGFARFFFIMLLVAPLAYIGASYYNGQDGIQNLKNLLGINSSTASELKADSPKAEGDAIRVNEAPATNQSMEAENKRLKEELEFKKTRIEELYRENEELKRKLESAEKVLEEAKK